MRLTLEEIREKEVVNLENGECFGFADDIIIETETKETVAIIIRGRLRLFGILGREEDIIIGWDEIETFGKDTILVRTSGKKRIRTKKEKIFQKISDFFL